MKEPDKEILLEQVRGLEKSSESNTAEILGERRHLSGPMSDAAASDEMRFRSRRSFLVGGVATALSVFGWRWMSDETRQSLVRGAFEFNERVSQVFYRPTRLAPEFAAVRISPRRVNGMLGLESEPDRDAWRLSLGGLAGRNDDLVLTLDDIKTLPRVTMTTELKCIEGWSAIVNWTGARFSDLVNAYPPAGFNGKAESLPPYVSLTTPDEEYFVGWDMPSIMHPQTLLAYEMNGEPLLPEHGAPLRLASPTKYGIKLIKRIGRIEFTHTRPRDFWAESGYDWYAGH